MTVDPETALPEEPVGAVTALFGSRADLARAFWKHLSTTAVERGLIGPREVPRLWDRHILNCAAISAFVPADATVVDVGSGAGLPGVAIAIARSEVRVTLVEPLQRRVVWLSEVIDDLGLDNVEVVRARAEEVRGRIVVDVATARAVAALPVLAAWCLPLVRPGGRLLALKGRSAADELAASVAELTALGATSWDVRTVGAGVLAETTTVIEVISGRRWTAPGDATGGGRAAGGGRRRPRTTGSRAGGTERDTGEASGAPDGRGRRSR